MKLTLLIDLDDTLLSNPMDQFIDAYFKLFGGFIKDHADPKVFIQAVLAGTDAMIKNQDPTKTLNEVFEEVFYPAFPLDKKAAQPLLDQFYHEVFPQLQSLCPPIPGAQEFISEADRAGHTLVVATNPIFPQTAIDHRIDWAELPVSIERFALTTNYETSHFAKPSPAYFAECLARLGWPEEPAVMIGNDFENDIVGSRILGLPAYLVNENRNKFIVHEHRYAEGPIAQVLKWLDTLSPESLRSQYSSIEALEAILLASIAGVDQKVRNQQIIQSHNQVRNSEKMVEVLKSLRENPPDDVEEISGLIFNLVGIK